MQEHQLSFATDPITSANPERRVLNIGDFSLQENARLLDAFEHLAPEDSLEIVTKKRTGQIVAELQDRYGTNFYWWPLERGPVLWRTILSKPTPGAPATVAAAMSADHQHLCELWQRFERALSLCQIDSVYRCSAELSLGLRRHIDIEETILFPLLEAQTHISTDSATGPMRAEHYGMERDLDRLDKLNSTKAGCAEVSKTFGRHIKSINPFQHHYRREEASIYPLMDIIFGAAEEHGLLLLLQEFEI